ncbi:FHA domain-containing protein [Candidatus Uabimicrobium sp. HlEnr_7]|uniref:FHA domain-containing protein n=1 Tax=Candidatus Uabimicrobium helgolandensis TaxID=3095367 RepID=UPI0035560ED1
MLVYLEDTQKKKHLIEEENFNIGRDGSRCQLKLPDNRLYSALQATIVVQEDIPMLEKYILVDRSSNKNTYVNGKRIDKKILKHGDRISFSEQQKFFVTFKLNTSAPTLVPKDEGYVKPKLEEKQQDLLATIKEQKTSPVGDVAEIGDKEIEDLRNFMQKSMLERNDKAQSLIETNDEISISNMEANVVSTEINSEIAAQKANKVSNPGEETEVDLKSDKISNLREAYEQMVVKKPNTTTNPNANRCKKLDTKTSANTNAEKITHKMELVSVLDGSRFPIEGGMIICGSSPKANICFPNDPSIVEKNFKLIKGEGSLIINPLDNENVIVNGCILRESQKLKSKDIIRVGRQILYFLCGNKKHRHTLSQSILQTKNKVKNFYTLQNAANDIHFGNLDVKISTKFCDKENILYCVTKNKEHVFVFIGDLISTNIGFALVVQELRGAFSALTELTDDLMVIARGFDRILNKYKDYSCEGNVPLVCKGLLLKLSDEKLSWLNCGSYLSPIYIDNGENIAKELSCDDSRVSLLGHLFDEEIVSESCCNFDRESALIIQPDCIPTKGAPKIMIKLKDVSDLLSKMKNPSAENAAKRLLSSNVTSLIVIQRKISELKCLQCKNVFPSNYVFCPYDSTKLV